MKKFSNTTNKDYEEIENTASSTLDFELMYKIRRHKQIEEAIHKAKQEKRKKQRNIKREKAKVEKAKDNISISFIKEMVEDDYEQSL